MKKIPIQVTDENVDYINSVDISFSNFLNKAIDEFKCLKYSKKEIKTMLESNISFKEIFA
jgi:DNA-binding transcriptional regulator YhcF (GntR family)